jgi:uncharacterized membrane protein YkvI
MPDLGGGDRVLAAFARSPNAQMHDRTLSASIRPVPRRPLDILNLTVFLILLTIAVVSALNGRLQRWELPVLRQVALIVGVLVIVRLDRSASKSKVIELLTNFYPIAVVPIIFDSLQPLDR